MTKKSIYIAFILIIFGIFLSSCKKMEDPIVDNGTPVFKITGYMDNLPLSIIAGKDNYYMRTSYAIDSGNIYVFSGKYEKTCLQCKEALQLYLRNYKATLSNFDYLVDSSFTAGDYAFYGSANTFDFKVQFTNASNGVGIPSHYWDFGDSTNSTDANPIKVYKKEGIYNVSYSVNYSGGCISQITSPIVISSTTGSNNVPKMNFSYVDTLTTQFISDSIAPTHHWDFGDGNQIYGQSPVHKYDSAGIYKVCLATYGSMDSLIRCQNIPTKNFNQCIANFNQATTIINKGNLNLSEITVEWTDKNGTVYSSKNCPQAMTDYFKIITHSPYQLNEKGQKTEQIIFEMSCTVSNGTQQIHLTQIKGTMAVALP